MNKCGQHLILFALTCVRYFHLIISQSWTNAVIFLAKRIPCIFCMLKVLWTNQWLRVLALKSRCFSEVRFPSSFTACHWSLFPFLAKIKWVFVIVYQKNKCIFAQNISSGSDCAAHTCCTVPERSVRCSPRAALLWWEWFENWGLTTSLMWLHTR